jgi:hypothetical protein
MKYKPREKYRQEILEFIQNEQTDEVKRIVANEILNQPDPEYYTAHF